MHTRYKNVDYTTSTGNSFLRRIIISVSVNRFLIVFFNFIFSSVINQNMASHERSQSVTHRFCVPRSGHLIWASRLGISSGHLIWAFHLGISSGDLDLGIMLWASRSMHLVWASRSGHLV